MIERFKVDKIFRTITLPTFPFIIRTPHKRADYTFNRFAEFAIWEGKIYMRRPGIAWQLVYYAGNDPIFIDSDSVFLMVIDRDGTIHYKKIFSEFRRGAIPKKYLHHFEGVELSRYDLYVIDQSRLANWKRGIFHIPFLSRFNEFKIDPQLHRSYAITTIGERARIYLLNQEGKSICVLGGKSIALPQNFIGHQMAVSESVIMVIGFEHLRVTDTHQMRLFVRLSGCGWLEQSLPNSRECLRTIMIAYGEMRIVGRLGSRWGYYSKQLDDRSWKFNADDSVFRGVPFNPS